MTNPRRTLVCPETTPYYHVYTRCVRRAFLCGVDAVSDNDYSHRKAWISERLATLAEVFAIKIASYAILSNHYHLVVYIDVKAPQQWSTDEVLERWTRLSGLPYLVQKLQSGTEMSKAERSVAMKLVEERRRRLGDLSWFMRFLNEYIARRANKEDGCKGRFFESRFKSQALLDEQAILTCMAYVDLNPIRAGVATSLESSDWTSIQQRIRESKPVKTSATSGKKEIDSHQEPAAKTPTPTLMPFSRSSQDWDSIPFTYIDYLALIDWTGRTVSGDKRGAIDRNFPSLLCSAEVDPQHWLDHMRINGNRFVHAVGKPDNLRDFAQKIKRSWLHGIVAAEKLFKVNQKPSYR